MRIQEVPGPVPNNAYNCDSFIMVDKCSKFPLAPCSFYVEEMERAIEMFDSGIITEIFYPISSFFYGARIDCPQVEIHTGHICIFLNKKCKL